MDSGLAASRRPGMTTESCLKIESETTPGDRQPSRAARSQRRAERLEQRAVDRVAMRIVFGVPLHAERKARGIRDADRLDGAVFRHALDDDALAGLQDALPVQRIDLDGLAAED